MQKLYIRVLVSSLVTAVIVLASPLEAATISVRWDAVSGATGYRIHYGTSSMQQTGLRSLAAGCSAKLHCGRDQSFVIPDL